jgi:precorrin-8X/cobalt-precorrin-8 methylmutase
MRPHEIERNSFAIIRSELGEHTFSEEELAVVVRVIHATADFEFRDILRFHPDGAAPRASGQASHAIRAGIDALQKGCTVVTDVRMVQVGISERLLTPLGGRTVCDIGHSAVQAQARELGLTRSTVAMRRNKHHIDGGIVAIGNAPTALLEVIRLVREEGVRPALIVGVPVGFVNTVESKAELLSLRKVPHITSVGRKGGSSVAVAIVNALLRLATHREEGVLPLTVKEA